MNEQPMFVRFPPVEAPEDSNQSGADELVQKIADYVSNNGYPHTRTEDEIKRDILEIINTAKPVAQEITESTKVAKALIDCDWSGMPIGNKLILERAVFLLSQPASPANVRSTGAASDIVPQVVQAPKKLADLIVALSLRVAEQTTCKSDVELVKEADAALKVLAAPIVATVPSEINDRIGDIEVADALKQDGKSLLSSNPNMGINMIDASEIIRRFYAAPVSTAEQASDAALDECIAICGVEEKYLRELKEWMAVAACGTIANKIIKLKSSPTTKGNAPDEASEQDAARQLKGLIKLMGYVQDGSDTTVKLFQDDATYEYFIVVGTKNYHGRSFRAALENALKDQA